MKMVAAKVAVLFALFALAAPQVALSKDIAEKVLPSGPEVERGIRDSVPGLIVEKVLPSQEEIEQGIRGSIPDLPTAVAAQGCGRVDIGYGIVASSTNCQRARAVVRDWFRKVYAGRCSRFRCSAGRFNCRARPPAQVQYEVRCALSGRKVTFTVVAD